jgi:hypothetical protein
MAPCGWNVANGASEDESEYTRVRTLMQREFGEELMVVDRCPGKAARVPGGRHLHHRLMQLGDDPEIPEILWEAYSERHRSLRADQDRLDIKVDAERVAVTHLPAPGRVVVHDGNKDRDCPDVVISINPTELGIEVIWPVSFRLEPDHHLLDGEILEDGETLVRRPIALFDLHFLRGALREQDPPPERQTAEEVADCKLLPELAPEHYRFFYADIDLRRRMVKRAQDESEWGSKHRHVVEEARRWLEGYDGSPPYGELFAGMQAGQPVCERPLLMLCPVTWKTLEILFAHGCLDKLLEASPEVPPSESGRARRPRRPAGEATSGTAGKGSTRRRGS